MIEKLVIHRFRGIREGVLEDIGKFNLLIGPNNSGKSSILEMLYLGGTSGRECAFILEEGVYEATTSLREDFLGLAPLPRVRERHGYRGDWEENPAVLTEEGGLEVNIAAITGEAPWTRFRLGAPLEEWGKKDYKRFSTEDIGAIALFSLNRPQEIPPEMLPYFLERQNIPAAKSHWHYLWQSDWVYKWDKQKPIDFLAVWVEQGTLPDPKYVLFFDFHRMNAHFTERFINWAYHNIPGWYEKTAQSMARVFPEMKGASVDITGPPDGQKGRAGHILFSDRTPLPIDQFGDGARHAFKVLTSLIALAEVVSDEHPGLFLWEDPELFMHPATLGRLLSEVIRLIMHKPIQMFLTTQSLEVIACLVMHLDQATTKEAEQVRTFRLDLSEGVLYVQSFVGKSIVGWLRFFGDPRLIGEDEMASPLFYLLSR